MIGGPKGHITAQVVGQRYRCDCGTECIGLSAYRAHIEAAFLARASGKEPSPADVEAYAEHLDYHADPARHPKCSHCAEVQDRKAERARAGLVQQEFERQGSGKVGTERQVIKTISLAEIEREFVKSGGAA